MITVKDFMEVIGYRITEGSEYYWKCFGPNAYRLDSWSGDLNKEGSTGDGYTISMIFDTVDQTVYEITAWDYNNDRAYRFMNPIYREDHDNEAKERHVDPNEAWDDVKFVDLEVEEDFLEKARAIIAGKEYDTRVQVPLNLEDEYMFAAMKMAHELDVTLNEFFEIILRQELDKEKPFGIEKPAAKMKKSKKKSG